jgi:hypothetical protein
MNIYSGLLFMHGHIANVALAQRLAEPGPEPEVDAAGRETAAGAHRSGRPGGSGAVAVSAGAGRVGRERGG